MNQPIVLHVYGAADCCLCDQADLILEKIRPQTDALGVRIEHHMIDDIDELEKRYRTSIPIGQVDGETLFKYQIDPDALLRMLGRRRQNLQSMR